MEVQAEIVVAILAFFGIGLIGVIETFKRILKLDGLGAYILTAVISIAATAVTLIQTKMFSVPALIVYSFLVFGEASGLYKVIKKR